MAEMMIVGMFVIKEGTEAEAEAAVKEFVAGTHEEPGCLLYAFHKVSNEPRRLVFIEKWADAEAVTAHMQAPHMKAFGSFVSDMLAEPPQFWQIEPIEAGDPAKRL